MSSLGHKGQRSVFSLQSSERSITPPAPHYSPERERAMYDFQLTELQNRAFEMDVYTNLLQRQQKTNTGLWNITASSTDPLPTKYSDS